MTEWAVKKSVSVSNQHWIKVASFALTATLLATALGASFRHPKKIKASANPPSYTAFSRPLSDSGQSRHALDRLTFGPRSGDLAALQKIGLPHWLDSQLHPERIPENAALMAALLPFQTLQMGIRDTYLNYPPPQLIAAVARGRQDLPDDPELRTIVSRLAARYLQRKDGTPEGVDIKLRLADLLTPEQLKTLREGKPADKRALLAAIPPEKRIDFAWALSADERRQLLPLAPVPVRRELMRAFQPQNVITDDLTEGKLLRATFSNRQLNELLVDFWFNHFNVTVNKGSERYAIPTYERESIRPYVLGSFHELLLQTARSPAMLFYLDNWQSSVASVSPARNPAKNAKAQRGLNENYGRELLELHTLGVDGGYTQTDVINVARCFTGWTIANPRKGGGFEYNDRMHDKGPKVVLGHTIKAGGNISDGLEVLDILSHHPATAHFLSLKLARRFVADDPPPSLVNRMSQMFLRSNGNLREVVRTMVESPEFWSEGAYTAKIKTPFEMVVSSLRATDADVASTLPIANELQKLGEPLYRKTEPTGYPSTNDAWVSSASLLERMNFSLALTHNRLPGITVNLNAWQTAVAANPMSLAQTLLQQSPSPQTQTAIQSMLANPDLQQQLAASAKAGTPRIPSLIAGLVLGSPEFQRH